MKFNARSVERLWKQRGDAFYRLNLINGRLEYWSPNRHEWRSTLTDYFAEPPVGRAASYHDTWAMPTEDA